ncbi:MAG: hypothetical protein MI976_14695 [Pseudomonadales bacterium]|nr:hypothetical protein [Pseudomonadales bacterium]
MELILVPIFFLVVGIAGAYVVVRGKNMDIWLIAYIKHHLNRKTKPSGPIHVMFCFVDHYEPQWETSGDDIETERKRVDRWLNEYPTMAKGHQDADGKPPQHTFFYPEEEYRKEHLDKVQILCEAGFGEVDIHLHHHDDTEENFVSNINSFKKTLTEQHGLLSVDENNEVTYGFIHGNWTLDNSHPDGINCGLNNEIELLRDTNCYVDMTLPSAPNRTQTTTVNKIYMAVDDPLKPKSHDKGEEAEVGKPLKGDLLMVQGPLALNWKRRKFGIMPRIENGDIRTSNPPTPDRVDLWVNQHIHVKGRPEWLMIKVHTHGTQEPDMDCLLGKPIKDMYSYLESKYNDGENYVLHYVNAREMTNIIYAAVDGHEGNPNDYRDYRLKRYCDVFPKSNLAEGS